MRLRSRYTAAPSDTVASCSSMSSPIFRRDAFSSRLLRYRDGRGDDRADIIDVLTMHPDARRQVARVLGELDALHRRGCCWVRGHGNARPVGAGVVRLRVGQGSGCPATGPPGTTIVVVCGPGCPVIGTEPPVPPVVVWSAPPAFATARAIASAIAMTRASTAYRQEP